MRIDKGEFGSLRSELRIEISSVGKGGEMRFERGLDAAMIEIFPVDGSEEGVLHDSLGIVFAVSESLGRVPVDQTTEQVFGFSRKVTVVERERGVHNFFVHDTHIVVIERRETFQHLIQESAQ